MVISYACLEYTCSFILDAFCFEQFLEIDSFPIFSGKTDYFRLSDLIQIEWVLYIWFALIGMLPILSFIFKLFGKKCQWVLNFFPGLR